MRRNSFVHLKQKCTKNQTQFQDVWNELQGNDEAFKRHQFIEGQKLSKFDCEECKKENIEMGKETVREALQKTTKEFKKYLIVTIP